MTTNLLMISGEQPALLLEGNLQTRALIVGNHGSFNITSTGKLITSSLTLSAWSEMSVKQGAELGSSIDKFDIDSIDIGYSANLKLDCENCVFETTEFKLDSYSKLSLDGLTKNLTIFSANFSMMSGAVMDNSNGGNSSIDATDTKGASYGGEGGNNPGTTFGSTLQPVEFGSGMKSAKGGGCFILLATGYVMIDGQILANGNAGSSGGGSGGSIYIQAGDFAGYGILSSNGGQSTSGGGGGGGRIAIKANSNKFVGKIRAYGGRGTTSGAAGTIYMEYKKSGGSQIKKLTIDNDDSITNAETIVTEISDLTEINIYGYSRVRFSNVTSNHITITDLNGDYTGTLIIQSGQSINLATSFGTLSPYALSCKIIVQRNSLVTLPAKVQFSDDDPSGEDLYNLEVYGTISGIQELTVSSGGKVMFHSKARSEVTNPEGTLSLNKVDVHTRGVLELGLDSLELYTLDVLQQLSVKYTGQLIGRNMLLKVPTLDVSYYGKLAVDGAIHSSMEGEGQVGTYGSGASHGGAGGISAAGIKPSVNYTGNFTTAGEFGAVGGDGSSNKGGYGGGHMELHVYGILTVDGLISSDGLTGNQTGGGGSGGSLNVLVEGNMVGTGMISVKGGRAEEGGGGGGGRVFVRVMGLYDYLGTFELSGGSSMKAQSGGAGTALIDYRKDGIPVSLYQLVIDNSDANGKQAGVTHVDIPGETFYDIEDLVLKANTNIWITTRNLHFRAQSLSCDDGSEITVGDFTVFSADVDKTYSAITCSFDLREEGELRLPNSVELRGTSNRLEGN